jgi:hypothetical protein
MEAAIVKPIIYNIGEPAMWYAPNTRRRTATNPISPILANKAENPTDIFDAANIL